MKFSGSSLWKWKSQRIWITLYVLLVMVLMLHLTGGLCPLLWQPPRTAEKTESGDLPLDVAIDSIDDMYYSCRNQTASVIDLFGGFERRFNSNFSAAWASAVRSAKEPVHQQLTEEHATVIYMYTELKDIHQDFNQAVKRGKYDYGTERFRFHYLYFYLTDAIQVLRHNQTPCRTSYHRTWKHFDQNVINTNMRFGAFTWAASSKHSFGFSGNVSCFQIYSCFGADITQYSAKPQEGQVLIPPYEVFKITDVLTDEPWCRVVYKLQSTEAPRRDLNCNLIHKKIKTHFGAFLTLWYTSGAGMMTACLMMLIIVPLVFVKRRQKRFVAAVLASLQILMIIVVILTFSR